MITTRETAMEELRSAFIELMGADRRLKARDPHPQPGDLSHSQLRALFKLEMAEEVTAGELAKRADISPASMTAMLDQLEKAGIVERKRSETDRRQVNVRLTEEGCARLKERKAAWLSHWQERMGVHSEEDLDAAARVFRTMAEMFDGIGR